MKAKAVTRITLLKIILESNYCSLRPSQTLCNRVINPRPPPPPSHICPLRIPFLRSLPQMYLFILCLYLCFIHKIISFSFHTPTQNLFFCFGGKAISGDTHAL